MYTLLVPVDFSPESLKALQESLELARKINANIEVFHAIKERSLIGSLRATNSSEDDSDIEKYFKTILAQVNTEGVEVTTYSKSGNVAKEIVRRADQITPYMIVMGTHGISGFEEFFAGSNAFRVISRADCPVLTVRGDTTPGGIKRIVMPIDTSSSTRQKVPFTLDLATMTGAEIHVLATCTSETTEVVMKLTSYSAQVCRYLEEYGATVINEFRKGNNIADMVIGYANEVKGDLIAIMTETETSLNNTFIGSFAQQLVNHSNIPILSMHKNPKLEGDFSIM